MSSLLVVMSVVRIVTADVKMRSRSMVRGLCKIMPMMHVREAQALIAEHQENKQKAREAAGHCEMITFV